jgi:hypothetical protein
MSGSFSLSNHPTPTIAVHHTISLGINTLASLLEHLSLVGIQLSCIKLVDQQGKDVHHSSRMSPIALLSPSIKFAKSHFAFFPAK